MLSALGDGELLALRGTISISACPHKPEIERYIEEIPDFVASTAAADFPFKSYCASNFSKVAVVVTAAVVGSFKLASDVVLGVEVFGSRGDLRCDTFGLGSQFEKGLGSL